MEHSRVDLLLGEFITRTKANSSESKPIINTSTFRDRRIMLEAESRKRREARENNHVEETVQVVAN